MAKQGRPRALDDGKRREVCAFLAAGASLKQAAEYVGCSVDTIRREQKRSEAFDERVRRANAAAQLAPLQAMKQAVQTHWRAAAWMLERSDPEHFGQQKQQFGSKELSALRRDLINVFEEEIEFPAIRRRVVRRVKAVIDYAMRHAWDKLRSGSKLREAMRFFEQRDAASSLDAADELSLDLWNPLDEVEAELRLMSDSFDPRRRARELSQTAAATASENAADENAAEGDSKKAKVVPFCVPSNCRESQIAEQNGSDDTQKE